MVEAIVVEQPMGPLSETGSPERDETRGYLQGNRRRRKIQGAGSELLFWVPSVLRHRTGTTRGVSATMRKNSFTAIRREALLPAQPDPDHVLNVRLHVLPLQGCGVDHVPDP